MTICRPLVSGSQPLGKDPPTDRPVDDYPHSSTSEYCPLYHWLFAAQADSSNTIIRQSRFSDTSGKNRQQTITPGTVSRHLSAAADGNDPHRIIAQKIVASRNQQLVHNRSIARNSDTHKRIDCDCFTRSAIRLRSFSTHVAMCAAGPKQSGRVPNRTLPPDRPPVRAHKRQ